MVNSLRLRYDYVTSVYLLVDALRSMGHEVDHRRVTFGEDLSKYDLALVGIGPPKSLTARHVHEACWTLREAKKSMLYCDDWSIAAAGGNTRSAIRCMPQWSKFMSFDEYQTECVTAGLMHILEGRWPLLAPMFPWGTHTKLVQNNLDNLPLYAWDPSPYLEDGAWQLASKLPNTMKEQRWVYATLQEHDKWLDTLNPQWPVERYGSYRAEDKYISESLLLDRYAASWGVLCPAYKSQGSGWWRVRYHHAAALGCVLKCSIEDGMAMSSGSLMSQNVYTWRMDDIENMHPPELAKLAGAQRDWFFEQINTREQTMLQLDNALTAAVDR